MQRTPYHSTATLVFWRQRSCWNFHGISG